MKKTPKIDEMFLAFKSFLFNLVNVNFVLEDRIVERVQM